MAVIINHFNLGMNYEAYFVCPDAHREYFQNVSEYLEAEMAAKAGVFCYDADELTADIRKKLNRTKNVVFALTEGAVTKAVEDENDPFREVYGYVWENNPHSLSLMSVNNCSIEFGIDYPDEMQSFKWLHRKSYNLFATSVAKMAEELYNEFRLGYLKREKRKLEKLAEKGLSGCANLYYKGKRGMMGALLWISVSLVVTLLLMFTKFMDSGWMIPLTFLAAIAFAIGIGYASYTVMSSVCLLIDLLDVSVLFGDFKRRTIQRIAFLMGAGLWGGICYGCLELLNLAYRKELDFKVLMIGIFAALMALILVEIIRSSVLLSAAEYSLYYLELCEKRPKIHMIFSIVYIAVLIAIAVCAKIFFQ